MPATLVPPHAPLLLTPCVILPLANWPSVYVCVGTRVHVCALMSAIRVWLRVYFWEREHLSSGYTTGESVSPPPSVFNCINPGEGQAP